MRTGIVVAVCGGCGGIGVRCTVCDLFALDLVAELEVLPLEARRPLLARRHPQLHHNRGERTTTAGITGHGGAP
jgi:hypothetical protein